MKKGQIVIVAIFCVLVVVAAVSFYLYYNPKVTGNVVEKKLTLEQSPADNLIVPEFLNVFATVGEENKEEFEVQNYNEKTVSVSCEFPSFQVGVPSSNCFSYDDKGDFVGSGSVDILPKAKHVFIASVRPFDGLRIKRGSSETVVTVSEGEYSGEIELQAWFEGERNESVSVISIPVKIFVEK